MMSEGNHTIDTTSKVAWKGQVTDAVFTVPNVISFCRLCLVPVFFVLLLYGYNLGALVCYTIAASTDWVDGLVARRTNSVSKLGRILDPAADRLLMIFSAVGLTVIERLPLWIAVIIIARDIIMLAGYFLMLRRYNVRVDVILAGKIATVLLYVGFFCLIANWPLVSGLGITTIGWLPGFTGAEVSGGIWLVYAGVLLGVFSTTYYATTGILACREAAHNREGLV